MNVFGLKYNFLDFKTSKKIQIKSIFTKQNAV